jgi:hypothetical protein
MVLGGTFSNLVLCLAKTPLLRPLSSLESVETYCDGAFSMLPSNQTCPRNDLRLEGG